MQPKFKLIDQQESVINNVCDYLKYPNRCQISSFITQSEEFILATSRSECKFRKLKPVKHSLQLDYNNFHQNNAQERYQKLLDIDIKQTTIKGLSDEKEIEVHDIKLAKMEWELGKPAEQQFNYHYKNLDNIIKQNTGLGVINSPLTNMIVRQQSNKLFPIKLGIVKKNKKDGVFKLTHQLYGDNYISALSEGQKLLNDVDKFILKNNRISEKSSITLIQNFNAKIQFLDLSFNNIGIKGCEQIKNYFHNPQNILQSLNLEQNNLSDQHFEILMDGMENTKHLQSLYLSNNEFTDVSAELITKLFKQPKFSQLYLHWNKIGEQGAVKIFKSLISNQNVKVIDLSWNRICGDQTVFCEFLKTNKHMVHLDLSHNFFQYKECEQISNALNFNKTLLGFHFQGNYGYMDNQGFLIMENIKNFEHPNKRRINGVQSLQSNERQILTDDKELQKDICWICDDWRFNEFKWTDESGGDKLEKNDLVFLNLSIVNYKALWMDKLNINNEFKLECMAPYKKTYYCFIVNGIPQIAQEQTHIPIKINIPNVQTGKKKIHVNLNQRNTIRYKNQYNSLFNENYQALRDYKIRTKIAKEFTYLKTRSKRVFNLRRSSLAENQSQKDDIYEKFLEFDFSNTKIDRICKNQEELQQIKLLWKPIYKQIIFLYKYYASLQPLGDVFAITINPFWLLIKEMEIMSNQFIEADIFLKWQGTVSGNPKGNPRLPDRGLVRHQLLEVLVRMAEQRYFKSGITKSLVEGVQRLIEINLNDIIYKYNHIEWKQNRYLNYHCDKVSCLYKSVIKDLFVAYSKKKTITVSNPFVSLDELMDLCRTANFFQREQNFTEKDVYLAYNLSKNIEVDEISGLQTQQMKKFEFQEALARLAEALSFPMIGDVEGEQLSYQERKNIPLCVKFESFLMSLLFCCSTETKQQYKSTDKSIFFEKGPEYITTVTEDD